MIVEMLIDKKMKKSGQMTIFLFYSKINVSIDTFILTYMELNSTIYI